MAEVDKAREALQKSEESRDRTNAVVSDAIEYFGRVKAHRERNHYREKVRLIMRGAI